MAYNALKEALRYRRHIDSDDAEDLLQRLLECDEDAKTEIDELLASNNLTVDSIVAEKVSGSMYQIEPLERMIVSAEKRRHVILREIDRHRAAFAERLRRATDQIEDAEFEEIKPERKRIRYSGDQHAQTAS